MKHRATGNPRGRPPSVPFDIGDQIYDILKSQMDPVTHLVRPQWKELATCESLDNQQGDTYLEDHRADRKCGCYVSKECTNQICTL